MNIPKGWPTRVMTSAAFLMLHKSEGDSFDWSDVSAALEAALAAAPTPPAQEDEPVYYEITTRTGVSYVAKHPSILPENNSVPLYARPDDRLTTRVPYQEAFQRGAASCDKLRKVAEEVVEYCFGPMKPEIGRMVVLTNSLRAALEEK